MNGYKWPKNLEAFNISMLIAIGATKLAQYYALDESARAELGRIAEEPMEMYISANRRSANEGEKD